MSFGPACERCGGCSYEGSQEEPVKCPWCHKPKRRGSREELIKVLNDAKHALFAAVGYVGGQSAASKESMTNWLVAAIKGIEDV